MQFIHCGVHRKEFRKLLRGEDNGEDEPEASVIIGCPTCGVWYFADLAPADLVANERPADLEAIVWQGEERLLAECPDHAHRFEVDSDKPHQ